MWLLTPNAHSTMALAQQSYAANPDVFASQIAAFSKGGEVLSVVGDVAQISIKGVLTRSPSWMASMFGGGNTTYPDIIQALASAEADPKIKTIRLAIDSPGGEVAGLFDAVDALQAAKKHIVANFDLAASAAYALAAQADQLFANSRASMAGSIGIVQSFYVDANHVDVTSSDAPNKRPDVTTEEGKAVVQAQLDGIHTLFVDAIAEGRGVTAKKVNTDFGRGGMMIAAEAIEAGLIDGIGAPTTQKPTEKAIAGDLMDANKLKAEHPGVYAEVSKLGADAERDRVLAFLTAGEASGDMAAAVKAINDGSAMTSALQTHFMMAAVAKTQIGARTSENPVVIPAAAATEASNAEAVAKMVAAELGLVV